MNPLILKLSQQISAVEKKQKSIIRILLLLLYFRCADQISVGDEVLVQQNSNSIPATVTNVSDLSMQGDCISSILFYISCQQYTFILIILSSLQMQKGMRFCASNIITCLKFV